MIKLLRVNLLTFLLFFSRQSLCTYFLKPAEGRSEASTRDVQWKKVFLKNFKNSQETTSGKCLRPATLWKKRLLHRCFPLNYAKFLQNIFFTEHLMMTTSRGCCRIKRHRFSGVFFNVSTLKKWSFPLRIQARRNEKILGGLGVYQKMLANLANRLRRSFNWNRLTLIWVGVLGVCFVVLGWG